MKKRESKKPDVKKQETGLWLKCQKCHTPIYTKNFEENLMVCERCGYHHSMGAWKRLETLVGKENFTPWETEISPLTPLNFEDFPAKLKSDQQKTNLNDAILIGKAQLDDHEIALGIMDFGFRGGSMGSVVGELVVRLLERAADEKLPAVIVTASGGARMQEGMLSLMQMPKTVGGVVFFEKTRLPYITILTNPTTAGVAASFASVADIILAEPGAIIGFSGRRVIEQTIREKLPENFQTSEFYLQKGFIDMVVDRRSLRKNLSQLLSYFV